MANIDLAFVSVSNKERSVSFDARRIVNWFPAAGLQRSRGKVAAYPTPGLLEAFTVGTAAAARCSLDYNGVGYFVVDGTFYTVSNTYTVTSRGSLLTTTGRVSIACNGVEVIVVDGSYGYIYTIATGSFARITDVDFPSNPLTVTCQDNYFLVNTDSSIYASDLLAGSSWNALSFGTAEGDPDKIEAVVSDHREVFVFGQKTVEVLYNAGSTPFAFARQTGVYIQNGCAARFSVAKGDNTLFFLSKGEQGRCQVIRLAGRYTPEVISTPAVSEVFGRFQTVSDAFGYVYQEGGHEFYVLTFPQERQTWALDLTTSAALGQYVWHERSSYTHGRHLANTYMFFNDKHVVGDYCSGKFYFMSQDYLDDNGLLIQRSIISEHYHNTNLTLFLDELEIIMEVGVGLITGEYTEPKGTLEVSRDGGKTWQSYGTRTLGKMGEYEHRVVWRRNLGKARVFTFRYSITDPVRAYVLGARSNYRVGAR